ncbi:hypothetical protein [Parendozoicomonas sp. Alg238-R29]|uniref:hypothetical protein n=1 Tax=Parendozoicomonas sp. Alg238-R29 TaxID=2993446 RepID=UPI00248D7271|nr:hypothetical protein [Parendozoicomonas sp. Alg238-R29]
MNKLTNSQPLPSCTLPVQGSTKHSVTNSTSNTVSENNNVQKAIPVKSGDGATTPLADYVISKSRKRKYIALGALAGFCLAGPAGAFLGALLAKRYISRSPEQELVRRLHQSENKMNSINRQINTLAVKTQRSWDNLQRTYSFKSVAAFTTELNNVRAKTQESSKLLYEQRQILSKTKNEIWQLEAPIRHKKNQLSAAKMRRNECRHHRQGLISEAIFGNQYAQAVEDVGKLREELAKTQNRIYSSDTYKRLESLKNQQKDQVTKLAKERRNLGQKLHPLAQHGFLISRRKRLDSVYDTASSQRDEHLENWGNRHLQTA